LGVRRAEPEKRAQRVIGSGLQSGNIDISLLHVSVRLAIYSGRMAMPSPLRARSR
jgi:hypothetical protein